VDPSVGLGDMEKRKFLTLLGIELRHLGRPGRSQSLYRLCYIVLCLRRGDAISSIRRVHFVSSSCPLTQELAPILEHTADYSVS
jgi:hypothetical protein